VYEGDAALPRVQVEPAVHLIELAAKAAGGHRDRDPDGGIGSARIFWVSNGARLWGSFFVPAEISRRFPLVKQVSHARLWFADY
jgi:hypothetical protein